MYLRKMVVQGVRLLCTLKLNSNRQASLIVSYIGFLLPRVSFQDRAAPVNFSGKAGAVPVNISRPVLSSVLQSFQQERRFCQVVRNEANMFGSPHVELASGAITAISRISLRAHVARFGAHPKCCTSSPNRVCFAGGKFYALHNTRLFNPAEV